MAAKTRVRFIGRIICALLSALLMLTAIPMTVSAASLKLSKTSITLTKGYKYTLKATGASNVKWSSSDSTVASVTSGGKVYAKKAGTAYITAKSGSLSAKCKVTVLNGKLTVSQSTVYVDEGDYETVTVTATGSHSIKAESTDKSIAKASWIKPWSGNNITMKVTGVSEGTAKIKVYMSKYTEVYKYVTVNVTGAQQEVDEDTDDDTSKVTSHIMTDKAVISLSAGGTDTIKVYTDNKDKLTASSADTSIATVSALKWEQNYGTYTVTAVKTGNTTITISASDNASLKKTITVVVAPKGDYYEVCESEPPKKVYNDIVLTWNENGKNKFMLVPAGYDSAYANTKKASASKKFEYYTIYDSKPEKLADSDVISSFNYTVSGKSVVRYVLLPEKYDAVKYQTITAVYTNKFQRWIIYNVKPNKLQESDVIEQWTANVNGQLETRYVLLPANYDKSRFEAMKKDDSAAVNTYYMIVNDPALISKKENSDTIESFNYIDQNGFAKTGYILLPKGYDKARRDTAIAQLTGQYEYKTIYTETPKQINSNDVVKSWKKAVDGQITMRYVLLPAGYSETEFNMIRDNDVAGGSQIYYTAFTTAPKNVNTAAGESVYTWTNPKTGTVRYMVLPANYSIVRRNDAVYADTNIYEYYTIYSSKPTGKTDKDTVRTFNDQQNGTYYMLLPENYTSENIDKGIRGEFVRV